jgi:hypothetical protein
MSKFNTPTVRNAGGTTPIRSEGVALTHEGGIGSTYSARSELFLLAVTNFVGESTFYEAGDERDTRYRDLIRRVVLEDGAEGARWISRLLIWLRQAQNLRTASLVGAVELVRACLSDTTLLRQLVNAPNEIGVLRSTIDQVCQRADEPGELLAYSMLHYGHRIPKPIKRGVSDAVRRLYTERALLKYDTKAHAFRFGDVLELTHPATDLPWQGQLFRHAIDRRHGHAGEIGDDLKSDLLHVLYCNAYMRDLISHEELTESEIDAWLSPGMLAKSGLTWEDVLSALGSRVAKSRLWEALIPTMGYMSLVRNLRNFEHAQISDDMVSYVNQKLSDPKEVARSRQLPLRFLAAYRAVTSLDYLAAIERALQHSLGSIPSLPGRTLVLIDTSGSMNGSVVGNRSDLTRRDASVIFGIALGQRCESVDVVSFSDDSRVFRLKPGEAVLRAYDRWESEGCNFSRSTWTAKALRKHFDQHARVVILTDEQARDGQVSDQIPQSTPLYTWNLAGYRTAHGQSGIKNRHTFGGLTDAGFKVIPLLERGNDQDWPF